MINYFELQGGKGMLKVDFDKLELVQKDMKLLGIKIENARQRLDKIIQTLDRLEEEGIK